MRARPPTRFAIIRLTGLLTVVMCVVSGCGPGAPTTGDIEPVTINGRTYQLEVAADDASREQGLMYRTEVPAEGGMLFIFDDAVVRSFWMGYCLVDIDIIYLDPRGRVTAAHRMKAEPPRREDESEVAYRTRLPSYSSGYPAQFAIELPAGSLDLLGVKVEDRIDLDLERLKRAPH